MIIIESSIGVLEICYLMVLLSLKSFSWGIGDGTVLKQDKKNGTVVSQNSYNPRHKSWHACPFLLYVSEEFTSSSLPPQFNVVYRMKSSLLIVSNIVGEGGGGEGFPILVMSLVIVSKIPCRRIFVLSDSGVPRTFVVDCRSFCPFAVQRNEKKPRNTNISRKKKIEIPNNQNGMHKR